MFRRFTLPSTTLFAIKNDSLRLFLGGSAAIGGGTGLYRGYSDTHSRSISECIFEMTKRFIVGTYIGVMYTITLPVTLPIAICATVWQFTDDDNDMMEYDNLLKLPMWKQEEMFE